MAPAVLLGEDRTNALRDYRAAMDLMSSLVTRLPTFDATVVGRRPEPESWSVTEIVHHIADTEVHHAVRLRSVLTEAQPAPWTLWDPDVYASDTGYVERDPGVSAALVVAIRAANIDLLSTLQAEAWAKTGIHPTYGPVDVAGLLRLGTDHLSDHVTQIDRALEGRA